MTCPDLFECRLTAAIIMSVTYGYKTTEPRDHFVELAEDAVERAIAAMLPGATIINTFPTCTLLFRQSRRFQVTRL